jgi:hypothetical protein
MLARLLTTILSIMTPAEAMDTTRPFRAPHQPILDVGRIGGGHIPTPDKVLRAHLGVFFLDELPSFRRHGLEVLRQPFEKSLSEKQTPVPPQPHDSGCACRRGEGLIECVRTSGDEVTDILRRVPLPSFLIRFRLSMRAEPSPSPRCRYKHSISKMNSS